MKMDLRPLDGAVATGIFISPLEKPKRPSPFFFGFVAGDAFGLTYFFTGLMAKSFNRSIGARSRRSPSFRG